MTGMSNKIFSVFTGIAGAYHILLAAAGFMLPSDMVARVINIAFGVPLDVDPELLLAVRFSSVYMLAFGVMLLILALNPVRYRALAFPALILFGLRFVNRLLYFNTMTASGMPVSRNVIGIILISLFFAGILVFLPKKQVEE